jgi:hypothetical protein
MKTADLIDMLASSPRAIERGELVWDYGKALAAGTACTAVLMGVTLGPRHDLASAVALPMYWVKLAFVAAIAALAVAGAYRAAVPARRIRGIAQAIGIVVAGMWIIGATALAQSPPQARSALVLGGTWTSCPWLIAGLSLPVFAAIAWAMRRMAPTQPRRAGAMAGLASGALGALVYSIHCPELGAPFLGTWYVAGMLIPAAIGALAGERLLRW